MFLHTLSLFKQTHRASKECTYTEDKQYIIYCWPDHSPNSYIILEKTRLLTCICKEVYLITKAMHGPNLIVISKSFLAQNV